MENGQIKVAEQEEILNITDKNIIVSASAGSGKTSVMIRKILKYILNGDCHTDQLLVLTYTKSAGLEMKKKLISAIKDNLDKKPSLQDELDLVQTSDISTFDSFCQKLVKKYFYVLSMDPNFAILEGSDQTYYQNLALGKAIKNMKKSDPIAFENLLENFSPTRDETMIKSLTLEIHNYLTSIYDREEFLKNGQNLYNPNLKLAENVVKTYYDGIFNSIKNQLCMLLVQCNNLSFFQYAKYINQVLAIIDSLLLEKNFAKMVDAINEISFPILRQEKTDEIGFREQIANQKALLVKQLDEIKKQFVSSENVKNSYTKCGKLIENLLKLLNLFEIEYNTIKHSQNMYDFDDIERFSIQLLSMPEINQEVKSTYKYIFVDEFQDANKVQEKIIFLLNNNNLFFVGDTKQSIYAFRQSDPDIFLNIEDEFSKSPNACAKRLNSNFRTNKNILEFVNAVFSVIMTHCTCGVDYKGKAQFVPMANYLDIDGEVCVSLDVILPNQEQEQLLPMDKVYSVKENAVSQNAQSSFDAESALVCQKIVELIGKEIYDKETGKVRKIGYNDITILLLKRGRFLDNLIEHLNETSIPFVVNVNQNLEECFDNQVLFNLIKLAINFCDDYSLYSVLTSPLFNFSDIELAYIKQNMPNEKYFYDAFKNYNQNDEIKQHINDFFKKLEKFYYNLTYKGINFALDDVVKSTNYLVNISFEEDFAQRKLNIISYIDSFIGTKYNFNVADYIRYRESAIRKEKVQTNKTFSEAVQITTMHSSKGLEYPVVILPFLNQDYTKEPSFSEIKINKNLGIGVKNYNDEDRTISGGIFYNACKIQNKQIDLSEKIRLLYVATTRAKNKLLLIGTQEKPLLHFNSDLQILQCNNYLSLILNALPQNILDKINNQQEFSGTLFGNAKNKFSVQKVSVCNIDKQEIIMPQSSQEEDVSTVAEFLSKDLSLQKSEIALKNSVSYLLQDENASQNYAPQNLQVIEHLKEGANDLGTLYHSVLEKIDFNNVNSALDVQDFIECNFAIEEIEQLKNIGYNNIYNNICLLKSYISSGDKILKEQKFVMRVPYCQVANSNCLDNVLIQGVIDLLIIKQNQIIIIDYKLSSKQEEQIASTYQKQLYLYGLAVEKYFKNLPVKKLILSLKTSKIIDM